MIRFAILISTKNRRADLEITLLNIGNLISRDDVECVIYDDGSTDGTFDFVSRDFPNVKLLRNEISKGYLYCRNAMLIKTQAQFAISLDDDAHFLSHDPLEKIESYFDENPECGAIAFRIFWGKDAPESTYSDAEPRQVKGFVGCGHAWRIEAWRKIAGYPEWFEFYGEENFASLSLFKQGFSVYYLPEILVHHRVDMKMRRSAADFKIRYRRLLRADYYMFFIFYPTFTALKKTVSSIFAQIRTKIMRGQPQLFWPMAGAVADVVHNIPSIVAARNKLTKSEYTTYQNLPPAKIYWNP